MKALLSLDAHKAFDNVLDSLADLHPGERTYNCIRSFLRDRTVELVVGDLRSPVIRLGGRGTPEGAVLSPFLFNLAVRTRPPKLNEVPGFRYTLFADDITLWTCEGSEGTVEETLQHATDIVVEDVNTAGLQCYQHKSELLLIRPPNRSKPKSPPLAITTRVNRQPVIHIEHMRVLGMIQQQNRRNGITIERLQMTVNQNTRLPHRVSARKQGVKEKDLLELVQALLVSRLTYALTYLQLQKTERACLDCIIRHTYKVALGLPRHTSTEKLLQLEVHNSIDELTEANRTSQVHRLQGSKTGRWILARMGLRASPMGSDPATIPPHIRDIFVIKPLPKITLAGYQDGRRARAQDPHKTYWTNSAMAYVDADQYSHLPHTYAICTITRPGTQGTDSFELSTRCHPH
ncbi:uncharacterized protein [Dermacentor albipictus]|uniref:uncharacterized protein n=1 Tax=Dermacentor albipictus TaxID=60249 RepID=UPI0038FCEA37